MSNRNEHLDVLKGFLVMVMVVYHAMNYFSTAGDAAYGYLRFVNGSFVFLSGYAIAFLQRDALAPDSRRAVGRGLRLLLLFTALNLLIGLLGMTSYRNAQFGIDRFIGDAYHVYVLGDSAAMAFRILAPIAYVVMLAPLYMQRSRLQPVLLAGTLAAGAAYTVVVPQIAPNVFFLLTGLSGICTGIMTSRRVAASPPWGWATIAVALAAAVLAMNFLSGNVLTYCVGICIVLKGVYDASRRIGAEGRAMQWLVLIGKYSLLSYIAQIAIVHALRLGLRPIAPTLDDLLVPVCLVTALLLVALCKAVAHLRDRSAWANTAYRMVFG